MKKSYFKFVPLLALLFVSGCSLDLLLGIDRTQASYNSVKLGSQWIIEEGFSLFNKQGNRKKINEKLKLNTGSYFYTRNGGGQTLISDYALKNRKHGEWDDWSQTRQKICKINFLSLNH